MHHNIVGALPVAAWYNATAGHVHHHRSVLMHWHSTGAKTRTVLVEWLSHCKHIKPGANRVASGLFQTGIHAVRAGFVYMVMLAVMSYNGGVFIVAVLVIVTNTFVGEAASRVLGFNTMSFSPVNVPALFTTKWSVATLGIQRILADSGFRFRLINHH
ncbi:hypothetical protein C3L33_12521, partial [Rhododendron williamsianum]